MKATDLMVGDWVNSDFGIFQINDIFEDAVRDDRGNDYEFDCIKPILLTGEILKNNGFKHLDISSPRDTINRFVWRYSTDSQNIDLSYNKLTKDYMLESFRIHMFPIIYVHELQNALRMGKIEKEIEL